MKKPYTKEYIQEALAYWKKQLKESEPASGEIDEDFNKALKVKRDAKEARAAAKGATIEAGDPMYELVLKHKKARDLAKKACANELKGGDKDDKVKFEKVIITNSCIKNDTWIDSKDSIMVICAAIHMPTKKGFLSRLFTGSVFKLGQNVGTIALRTYVREFLGKSFERQVDQKHVFDGVDEEKDRVKYYVAFKLIDENTKMDEKEETESK